MNYLRSALNHAHTWYKRTFMARLIFAWLAIYGLRNAFFSETWSLIEPFPLRAFFRYHAQLIHRILRGSYLQHRDLETTSQPDTSRRHRLRATSDSASEDARQVSPIANLLYFLISIHTTSSFSPSRVSSKDKIDTESDSGHPRSLLKFYLSRILDSNFKIKVRRIWEVWKRYGTFFLQIYDVIRILHDLMKIFSRVNFCNYIIFYKFRKLRILYTFVKRRSYTRL